MSLLYVVPGVFFSVNYFFVHKPSNYYWTFLDKVFYLKEKDKTVYMIVSYLLALLHYYVLILVQRMESIGLNVMLEQEDVVISRLVNHIGLKRKTEKMTKRNKLKETEDGELKNKELPSIGKMFMKAVDTSGWKSEDSGTIDLF